MKWVVEIHGLIDIWREKHYKLSQYTWVHSRGNVLSMARPYRLYCSKHHFSLFKECNILPVGFSDHSMVTCSVFIANSQMLFFLLKLFCFWKNFRTRKSDFMFVKQWWDRGKTSASSVGSTLSMSPVMTSHLLEIWR